MIGKTQEKVTEQLGLRFVLEEATCEAALEKFANMNLKECYKFSAVFLDPPYNKNDRNFLDTDEERSAVFKNLAAVMAYPGVAFISVNQDRVHRVRAAVNKTSGLTMPDQAFLVFWKARENRGQPKIAGKPGYEHVCIVYSTRPVAEKSGGKKKKKRKKQGESGKGKSTCRESRLFPDLEGQFYKRFPEQRGVIHGKARQNYRLDYVPPSATERVIDPTTRKAIRPKSQKTVSWYEYFILKHSKCPGARIMDGFMGTAASAIAAVKCGAAKYVGVEPDPVVFAIARARLNRFLTSKSASEHQFGDMVDNGPEEQLRETLIDTPLSQMNTSPPENLTVKQYCEMANVEIRNSKLKGVDGQPLGKGLYTTAALKVDRDEGWVGVYIWGAVESADGPGEEDAFYMTFTEAPTNRARIKINTNCPGMYVNSCAGTGKRANMEFVERADQVTSSWRCIQGKLLCDVDAGDELLVMYNGNFWEAPTEAAVELAASEKAVQGGGRGGAADEAQGEVVENAGLAQSQGQKGDDGKQEALEEQGEKKKQAEVVEVASEESDSDEEGEKTLADMRAEKKAAEEKKKPRAKRKRKATAAGAGQATRAKKHRAAKGNKVGDGGGGNGKTDSKKDGAEKDDRRRRGRRGLAEQEMEAEE